jgi:hypothetical protein
MRALVLAVALSALIAGPAMACGSADKGKVPPLAADKGKAHVPRLAAAVDRLLPGAELSAADLAKVTALRAEIMKLAATGKEEAAREAEEQAMKILGYTKGWLKCGSGTFTWIKLSGA